jgi:hypothetical protein
MKKALAIFNAYYRRLEGAVGRFIGSLIGEHRTPNTEHRTSNGESAGRSVSMDSANAAIEDKSLPTPRSSEDLSRPSSDERFQRRDGGKSLSENTQPKLESRWNQVKGADKIQHPTSDIEHPTSSQAAVVSVTQPDSAFRTTIATFENRLPGSAAVPVASLGTGERDAHGPRQANARGEAPSPSEFRVSSFELPPDFITRDELKRELDSLRRLIESRK